MCLCVPYSHCHFDLSQGSSTGRYPTFVEYYLTPDMSPLHLQLIQGVNAHMMGMLEVIFSYIHLSRVFHSAGFCSIRLHF